MTQSEVERVLQSLRGDKRLIATFLYGTGLRLLECSQLRVHDLDYEIGQLTLRDGKGQKDRVSVLLRLLIRPLQEHL